MHDLKTREKMISRGLRFRESLWLMLEAVQKQEGDSYLNQTAEKAIEEYVQRKLAA
jgi:NADH:ubiquinone oxidoreductase subunit E